MELNTLIQRAKEKDPSAFDTIYRTYYPKMMGLCMNITRDDRSTAGDLVHDAFILAFASIGSLRDNTKFSEWLASIVRWCGAAIRQAARPLSCVAHLRD